MRADVTHVKLFSESLRLFGFCTNYLAAVHARASRLRADRCNRRLSEKQTGKLTCAKSSWVFSVWRFSVLWPAQPAFAGVKCVPVNCHVYHGTSGPVRSCEQRCAPAPTAYGSGPPTNIQQQKNRRMN
jgi:hypothetical protein